MGQREVTPVDIKPIGTIRRRPHAPIPMPGKCKHWLHCKHCGLIYIKNEPTKKAIKKRVLAIC